MWVYVSEPGLWTVGHGEPGENWHPDSDHGDREAAAQRCAWLNGARPQPEITRQQIGECWQALAGAAAHIEDHEGRCEICNGMWPCLTSNWARLLRWALLADGATPAEATDDGSPEPPEAEQRGDRG